jgi:FKBP-type peptidyl-prolyl cis-trans isomerase FkpA
MMREREKRIGLIVIAGIAIVSISSCNQSKKYEREERERIQTYLSSHDTLDFEKKPSGLYYMVDTAGTGPQVAVHDSVFIMFNGYYLTGTKFATNYGTTDTLNRRAGEGDFIAGVDEAITYMRAGGKSKVLVPSFLGYGNSGYRIPAYTPLLYDIWLVRLSSNSVTKK